MPSLIQKRSLVASQKATGTTENRLQIDAASLRQALAKNRIRNLGWIPGKRNPADGLTRLQLLQKDHPLLQLIENNYLEFIPDGWIQSISEKKKC